MCIPDIAPNRAVSTLRQNLATSAVHSGTNTIRHDQHGVNSSGETPVLPEYRAADVTYLFQQLLPLLGRQLLV